MRIFLLFLIISCSGKKDMPLVPRWATYEVVLTAEKSYDNPYTDTDVHAVFTSDRGDSVVRPGFWDGGNTWKVRFAPPDTGRVWHWVTVSSGDDNGLSGRKGALKSVAYTGNNNLLTHGLLQMSPGKRNVVHADGTPFLMIGDTPWALPFRATYEDAAVYAADRKARGFNTALLMCVQPDMQAEGPDKRDTPEGFARAFDDLPEGKLNKLRPEYFQYFDSLTTILIQHGIVPVYQPVFHGFGWKGKAVAGPGADPGEYARFCRYLVARYGSNPAFYLVSADANGLAPGVKPAGEMIQQWDAYEQPTGIHYNPCDNWLAPWAANDSTLCFHYNRTYQAERWLDFQWAQSGHGQDHLMYKVSAMYENKPVKAVANGEPTYEGMDGGKNGLGWWQGHDAWSNLMNGGTMGVVYGAASLWQWKVTADEPGWEDWCEQPLSWKEAMKLEGSQYVGLIAKAFQGFDFTDMEKRWDLTTGNKPLLAVPGKFYISYLESGGEISVTDVPQNLDYFWFNPLNGEMNPQGKVEAATFVAPANAPYVLIIGKR